MHVEEPVKMENFFLRDAEPIDTCGHTSKRHPLLRLMHSVFVFAYSLECASGEEEDTPEGP